MTIHFQTTVGRDDGEWPRTMFVAMGSDLLGESGGTLVGLFDGCGGDILLDQLPDLVGKINNLVKFAGGGGNVSSNIEGTGKVEKAVFIDFTIGGNLGKLSLGGHGQSSLNLPHVAAGT
jgi:hypothetical protein